MENEIYLEFDRLEGKHWWFRGRRRYLNALVRKVYRNTVATNSELEFCEVGAGTGGNLRLLTEFAAVDAVEMNELARSLILKKKPERVRSVVNGSLPDDIPLTDKYDGVFSLDVIEHVEQDLLAIKRLSELVKPDGFIVTTVPAYQWLWSKHDDANHHKRRYTCNQYHQLFLDAGLKIEYASYFNTILFPLAVLSRLWSRFVPRPDATAELSIPGKYLNGLFYQLFSLESYWAGRVSMPFGLSIVLIASKVSGENKIDQ